MSNAGFSQSEFYHPGGSVFGAVYTPDKWYGRKIGASVVSLPYLQADDIAIKARVEYDEAVLKNPESSRLPSVCWRNCLKATHSRIAN